MDEQWARDHIGITPAVGGCGTSYHDERGDVQDCTSVEPCRACLRRRIEQLEAQRGGAVVVPDDACPRVEQTILHVPGVSRGNCFSATVAGLLKLPIESIPQFATTDDKSWQEQFNEWLHQFGLAWFPMAGDDLAGECQQFGIEGLWSEMSGKSPRFDVGHSCVAKDGRLAWDPHPSQSGLARPIWWHGVFLALRPWESVSHIHPIPADRVLEDGMVGVDREEWEALRELLAQARVAAHTVEDDGSCDMSGICGAVLVCDSLRSAQQAKGPA